ncbi:MULTISPECIES: hypothetical protein [Bacillota]|uniref:hypothetical protein n=1 Tax=Bacillota TaxID=1239 RepID=UPI0039EFF921
MMKFLKEKLGQAKAVLLNQKGNNEIAVNLLLILAAVVILGGAWMLLDPEIDAGLNTLITAIRDTFESISGL